MAISLSTLQRRQANLPPRILLYGGAGVGKTTLAACAPAAVFVPTEDGLGKLDVISFPQAKSFADVLGAMDALLNEQHNFESFVIDSLDWLEPLIWAEVCIRQKVNSMEELNYGKGYMFAIDLWREYIGRLNRLRTEKGMLVIQIAHAVVRRFDSPEHEPYDRYDIKLHQKAAALLVEHSDCVLFCNYRVSTTKTDVGFNKKVTRAVGDCTRLIFTSERPAFLAKNRYNLPGELPMEWPTLEAYLAGTIPTDTVSA
ncbi:MAG: ATP-binding protein [Magnetococcales bacterium]|nr:ATP-binding protein [Magnetococcales bacterium]